MLSGYIIIIYFAHEVFSFTFPSHLHFHFESKGLRDFFFLAADKAKQHPPHGYCLLEMLH